MPPHSFVFTVVSRHSWYSLWMHLPILQFFLITIWISQITQEIPPLASLRLNNDPLLFATSVLPMASFVTTLYNWPSGERLFLNSHLSWKNCAQIFTVVFGTFVIKHYQHSAVNDDWLTSFECQELNHCSLIYLAWIWSHTRHCWMIFNSTYACEEN